MDILHPSLGNISDSLEIFVGVSTWPHIRLALSLGELVYANFRPGDYSGLPM